MINHCCWVTKLCLTLCDSMDCSTPGFSVHGIFQAKVLEWVAISFSREGKEGWVPENWCFQTVVLEKTLKSPLDCEEIKPVNSKGNQPWIFIGSTNAEAPILWLWRADSLEKTLMLGTIKGKRRRGKQRMRWLDNIINSMDMNLSKLGDSEGLEILVYCSAWGCKELDMT